MTRGGSSSNSILICGYNPRASGIALSQMPHPYGIHVYDDVNVTQIRVHMPSLDKLEVFDLEIDRVQEVGARSTAPSRLAAYLYLYTPAVALRVRILISGSEATPKSGSFPNT